MLVAMIVSLPALPFAARVGSTVSAASKTPAVATRSTTAASRQAVSETAELGDQLLRSAQQAGASAEVAELALRAVQCGVASGDLERPTTLTVIDYSRPSTDPRLWVFD